MGRIARLITLISVGTFLAACADPVSSADEGCDCADLEVTKRSNVQEVATGDSVTYEIIVFNHGPRTATNVEMTDLLSVHSALLAIDLLAILSRLVSEHALGEPNREVETALSTVRA